ncbi:phosphatidylinositol 4-phosphate 5-kinase 6-like [Actinia tenebrosa]|uniref:Phosphatidylinositol 4-phosphate 5-kinase 6-like n=1 Tax=Actinia tenebrosa TaxID=6105 RepID=A0A6P8IQJ6_ACTTE|nr:phosphatidylinositol 4-phosphate 5-kinase 6-like [Actinia tenebrosa]
MGIFFCCCVQGEETSDYENINNYEGETKLGKRHGKGVYYFENGDIYDGQWQWGKKHGHGSYTFADGSKNTGFFFNDEYIGDTPGNLFSNARKERDPARPLMQENNQTFRNIFVPPQEPSEELQRRRRERQEERREASRRREEMRRKYNL